MGPILGGNKLDPNVAKGNLRDFPENSCMKFGLVSFFMTPVSSQGSSVKISSLNSSGESNGF